MLVPCLNGQNIDKDFAAQKPSCESMPLTRKALLKSLRYPTLVGEDWVNLPLCVQIRFVKSFSHRKVIVYQGRIHKTRLSKIGLILAKLSKFIGAPLPQEDNVRGPATVIVKEARDFEGQYWTRLYPSSKTFLQVIQSVKRFAGPTGLEEIISKNIGIALDVKVKEKTLFFISNHYFLLFGKKRIVLPRFLSPGRLVVEHRETGPKRFRYSFCLHHPVLGELIYQTAIFEEIEQ